MSSLADTAGPLRPSREMLGESIISKKEAEALIAFVMSITGTTMPPRTATTMMMLKMTITTELMLPILPSLKRRNPYQNANEKLAYIEKNMGES